MQPALLLAMIAIALVTWLPDAAKPMRRTYVVTAVTLNDAVGDVPLLVTEGD